MVETLGAGIDKRAKVPWHLAADQEGFCCCSNRVLRESENIEKGQSIWNALNLTGKELMAGGARWRKPRAACCSVPVPKPVNFAIPRFLAQISDEAASTTYLRTCLRVELSALWKTC